MPPRKNRSGARCWPSARAAFSTAASGPRIAVQVGDEILFGKYGGTDIEVDGKDSKILRESDILAKVLK